MPPIHIGCDDHLLNDMQHCALDIDLEKCTVTLQSCSSSPCASKRNDIHSSHNSLDSTDETFEPWEYEDERAFEEAELFDTRLRIKTTKKIGRRSKPIRLQNVKNDCVVSKRCRNNKKSYKKRCAGHFENKKDEEKDSFYYSYNSESTTNNTRNANNSAQNCSNNSARFTVPRTPAPSHYSNQNILPASDLGIQDHNFYQRLLQIVNGANITPEDYDLLLQLDSKNYRKTMDAAQMDSFDTFKIGEGGGGLSQDELQKLGNCCICLTRFQDAKSGMEVRRLPCGHAFCRCCIDQWLGNNSVRCPDLSCYWSQDIESNVDSDLKK